MSQTTCGQRMKIPTLWAILSFIMFASLFFPAQSQIHWNRGWGAGGSVGKRSSFLADQKSYFEDLPPPIKQISNECSASFSEAANLITKIIQKEIEDLIYCESQIRISNLNGRPVLSRPDHLSSSTRWSEVKKMKNYD